MRSARARMRGPLDPATPHTIEALEGPRVRKRSDAPGGTTTTGHLLVPASSSETLPKVAAASRERPRDPTTKNSAS